MPTGDNLSVLLTLLSLVGGTGVAAYATSGAKGRNLWIFAGAMLAFTVAWWFWPHLLWFDLTKATRFVMPLVPIVTISVVAIMLRDRSSKPQIGNAKAGHRALVTQISNAINAADWEDYDPSQGTVDEAISVLDSAFASLRKQYGFMTPQVTERSKRAMLLGRNYLRRIQPFLTAGHIDEAKAAAEKFLRP